jgi:hypothetical protein
MKSMTRITFSIDVCVRGSDGVVLDVAPVLLGNLFVGSAPAVAGPGGRWLSAWHQNATHVDPYASTQGAFVSSDGTKVVTAHCPKQLQPPQEAKP